MFCWEVLYSNTNFKSLAGLSVHFFLTLCTTYKVEKIFFKPSNRAACSYTQSKGDQVAQDKFKFSVLKDTGIESGRSTTNFLHHSYSKSQLCEDSRSLIYEANVFRIAVWGLSANLHEQWSPWMHCWYVPITDCLHVVCIREFGEVLEQMFVGLCAYGFACESEPFLFFFLWVKNSVFK